MKIGACAFMLDVEEEFFVKEYSYEVNSLTRTLHMACVVEMLMSCLHSHVAAFFVFSSADVVVVVVVVVVVHDE